MWIACGALLAIWFVLKVLLHKGGYVHIILIGVISMVVVQLIAIRKAQHHKNSARS